MVMQKAYIKKWNLLIIWIWPSCFISGYKAKLWESRKFEPNSWKINDLQISFCPCHMTHYYHLPLNESTCQSFANNVSPETKVLQYLLRFWNRLVSFVCLTAYQNVMGHFIFLWVLLIFLLKCIAGVIFC